MTSEAVNLLSALNWSIFWAALLIAVVVAELATRSRRAPAFSESPVAPRSLATTTLPGLLLAVVLVAAAQAALPALFPTLSAARGTAALSDEALRAQGETMFRTKGCLGCHTIQGVSEIGTIGPELTHIASTDMIADEIPYSADNLRDWLTNPHEIKPGTQMPNMNLSPDELDAIVAYLDSLE